jgi:hypothetical protein
MPPPLAKILELTWNIAESEARDWLAITPAIKESVDSQLPGRENGPADAYRHLLWGAELTRRFGPDVARKMLETHLPPENSNWPEIDWEGGSVDSNPLYRYPYGGEQYRYEPAIDDPRAISRSGWPGCQPPPAVAPGRQLERGRRLQWTVVPCTADPTRDGRHWTARCLDGEFR